MMNSAMPHWMMRRGSKRSASAPAATENSRNGSQCETHREARQRRRMEFLEQHPVADDVLDVVGHHRKHVGDELGAETRVTHRGEGAFRRRSRRRSVFWLNVQEGLFSGLAAAA